MTESRKSPRSIGSEDHRSHDSLACRKLPTAGFARISAIEAHLRTGLAAVFVALGAHGGTISAELFAKDADFSGQCGLLLVQCRAGHAHVMARFAHFGALRTILFAAGHATFALGRALSAFLRAVWFRLPALSRQVRNQEQPQAKCCQTRRDRATTMNCVITHFDLRIG